MVTTVLSIIGAFLIGFGVVLGISVLITEFLISYFEISEDDLTEDLEQTLERELKDFWL